jgi:hypothetical protein
MEPSPNAKPVSQDIERAFSLLWGIGRVYDLFGVYVADRRLKRAKFPTRDTKPTEKECRAALARVLVNNPPYQLLRELAAAIYPEGDYVLDISRRVKFEKLGQGHHDAHRDFTVAAEVRAGMRKGASRDEACIEIAKQAGISFERVRDICQEQKALLDALDKACEPAPASESDLTPASDS